MAIGTAESWNNRDAPAFLGHGRQTAFRNVLGPGDIGLRTVACDGQTVDVPADGFFFPQVTVETLIET